MPKKALILILYYHCKFIYDVTIFSIKNAEVSLLSSEINWKANEEELKMLWLWLGRKFFSNDYWSFKHSYIMEN